MTQTQLEELTGFTNDDLVEVQCVIAPGENDLHVRVLFTVEQFGKDVRQLDAWFFGHIGCCVVLCVRQLWWVFDFDELM